MLSFLTSRFFANEVSDEEDMTSELDLDADEKPQQEVILKQFSYPGANVKNFFVRNLRFFIIS